jgi:hypothetical protein
MFQSVLRGPTTAYNNGSALTVFVKLIETDIANILTARSDLVEIRVYHSIHIIRQPDTLADLIKQTHFFERALAGFK